jgi:glycolate oxidase
VPLDELLDVLPGRVLTEPGEVVAYCTDSSRASLEGLPRAVVTAQSTDDVSTAMRWASRYRVKVSVRGSGTGLTGGAVAYPDGLVVSLAAMDRIIGIDPANRLADVQAGVVTAQIDRAAAAYGLMYAPDPASYRESTIGGNIATNAGGLRCVKYGVTADSVAGLEVVLACGDVIRTGGRTRKDVVGYDLTRLFVGSEGTLGVVTGATVRLVPRPTGDTVTFRAVFPSLACAGGAVTAVMRTAAVPEVMELMDRPSVDAVERHHPTGLSTDGAAAVLVGQFIGPSARVQAGEVSGLCREAGALSVDEADGDVLLEARRVTGRALSADGLRVSSDVAVPIAQLADMFTAIERISREEGAASRPSPMPETATCIRRSSSTRPTPWRASTANRSSTGSVTPRWRWAARCRGSTASGRSSTTRCRSSSTPPRWPRTGSSRTPSTPTTASRPAAASDSGRGARRSRSIADPRGSTIDHDRVLAVGQPRIRSGRSGPGS